MLIFRIPNTYFTYDNRQYTQGRKKGKQFNTEGLKWTGLLFILKIKTANNTKVGKVHPCTGHMAHRGSRGIALPFLDHGTKRG
jgi:hypothetical protein